MYDPTQSCCPKVFIRVRKLVNAVWIFGVYVFYAYFIDVYGVDCSHARMPTAKVLK